MVWSEKTKNHPFSAKGCIVRRTYSNVAISKTLGKDAADGLFMLSFDNSRSRREDAERRLSQTCLGRLASLEKNPKKFGPLLS